MAEQSGGGTDLQFDTAVPQGGSPAGAAGTLTCAVCSGRILSTYYHMSGQTTCAACRTSIGQFMETPTGAGPLVKAGLFGIGAGIAGAIVYYAVIALTGLEIGLVAILIGYMVGYMVRKGAGGGGRRFQIMALVLTYGAVALAYTPLVIKAAIDARQKNAQAASALSTKAGSEPETSAIPSAGAIPAASEPKSNRSPIVALVLLVGLVAALPVLAIVGDMPSGLISAAIIFFGMAQAWKMTARPNLEITGPYRVGAAPPPAVPV